MEFDTVLRLKNFVTLWLILGNGLLTVWAGGLYLVHRQPSRAFFNILVFLQLLVGALVLLGMYLLGRQVSTNPGHVMYGVLNGALAVVRVGLYPRLTASGRGGTLWQGFLALLAVALVARSSVTALYQ